MSTSTDDGAPTPWGQGWGEGERVALQPEVSDVCRNGQTPGVLRQSRGLPSWTENPFCQRGVRQADSLEQGRSASRGWQGALQKTIPIIPADQSVGEWGENGANCMELVWNLFGTRMELQWST